MPDAPPRLEVVFQRYDPPLFFVTFNTHHRKKLLANAKVHAQFVSFAELGQDRGIAVGRYVIMPDHIHLFGSGSQEFLLTQWVRLLKRSLSKVILSPPPHWQGLFRPSHSPSRELFREMGIRATESGPCRVGLKVRRVAMAR